MERELRVVSIDLKNSLSIAPRGARGVGALAEKLPPTAIRCHFWPQNRYDRFKWREVVHGARCRLREQGRTCFETLREFSTRFGFFPLSWVITQTGALLRIKPFYGTSPNDLNTQLNIDIFMHMLVTITQRKLKEDLLSHEIRQIRRVSLLGKIPTK